MVHNNLFLHHRDLAAYNVEVHLPRKYILLPRRGVCTPHLPQVQHVPSLLSRMYKHLLRQERRSMFRRRNCKILQGQEANTLLCNLHLNSVVLLPRDRLGTVALTVIIREVPVPCVVLLLQAGKDNHISKDLLRMPTLTVSYLDRVRLCELRHH
jgi:hypothetical protein